jgi:hypothetical protein
MIQSTKGMKEKLRQENRFHLRFLCLLRWLAVFVSGVISCNAQMTDPGGITQFWADWMVRPSTTGPRFYVRTERDILQTSPTAASFQRGSSEFILADGGVGRIWLNQYSGFFEEWDTDKDGFRDIVEINAKPRSNETDPLSIPTGVTADVYWTSLADGRLLPVNRTGSFPAGVVRPYSGGNVKLTAAPGDSQLRLPLSFFD